MSPIYDWVVKPRQLMYQKVRFVNLGTHAAVFKKDIHVQSLGVSYNEFSSFVSVTQMASGEVNSLHGG